MELNESVVVEKWERVDEDGEGDKELLGRVGGGMMKCEGVRVEEGVMGLVCGDFGSM